MKHSESLKNIAPAIRKAQESIKGAIKDSQNPFFKSKYADLESCWDAVKEPLQSQGLCIIQTMGFIQGAGPTLITTLLHESGEYITGEQPVCGKGDSPQEIGSAITFARRYGLSAIVGLIQVDDDGHAASKPHLQAPNNVSSINPGSAVADGEYLLRFGKYKGKKLSEIGVHDLNNYLQWLRKEKAQGEPDSPAMEAIEAFLKSREVKK